MYCIAPLLLSHAPHVSTRLVSEIILLQTYCMHQSYHDAIRACYRYSSFRPEQSIGISMSVCISRTTRLVFAKCLRMLLLAVARSSFVGVAICYLLPVLWMTSRVYTIARIGDAKRRILRMTQHDAVWI